MLCKFNFNKIYLQSNTKSEENNILKKKNVIIFSKLAKMNDIEIESLNQNVLADLK